MGYKLKVGDYAMVMQLRDCDGTICVGDIVEIIEIDSSVMPFYGITKDSRDQWFFDDELEEVVKLLEIETEFERE